MTLVRGMLSHRLLSLALLLVAAAGVWAGWLWMRDLSVLRIKHVEIEGAHGREAPAIRRALRQTAMRMTTLHVEEEELERAVDSFPVVRSVSASVDLPTTLQIKVDAHEPVAVLTSADSRRIAVSAGGIMLRGMGAGARLPQVKVESLPDSREIEDGAARALVSVLGGAPPELRRFLTRAYGTRTGARIVVRDGPVIQFGGPRRIAAKWAAVARVLADSGSAGADVIDVRLPERPAARGGDVGDESAEASSDAPVAPVAQAAAEAVAEAPATGPTGGVTAGTSPTPAQPTATGPTAGTQTYAQP